MFLRSGAGRCGSPGRGGLAVGLSLPDTHPLFTGYPHPRGGAGFPHEISGPGLRRPGGPVPGDGGGRGDHPKGLSLLYRQPVDPVSLSRLPIPRKCGDQQRHRPGHQTRDGDPPPLRRRGGSGLVSGRGPGGAGGSGRGLLPGAGRRRGAALGEAGETQEGRGQGRRERRASPSARVRVSWG